MATVYDHTVPLVIVCCAWNSGYYTINAKLLSWFVPPTVIDYELSPRQSIKSALYLDGGRLMVRSIPMLRIFRGEQRMSQITNFGIL